MRPSLAEVLQRELELLLKLRDLCLREQEHLRKDDLQGIQKLLAVKEQTIKELISLEREREEMHRDLAVDFHLPLDSGPKDLLAAGGLSQELEETIEQMRAVLAELKEINETNTLLIRQSLAYVRKMLALLTPHLQERSAVIDKSV